MIQHTSNTSLRIEPLTTRDLERVALLQPEGWGDILPSIQFYCESDFCFPLKAIIDGILVGIGSAIIYGKTAWLAHIIVQKDYRNKGLGTAITSSLIDLVHKSSCKTILLIATELGEPVYRKFGFLVQTQYLFFDHGALPPIESIVNVVPFDTQYERALLQLDYKVSGEDRKRLLKEHTEAITLFIEDRELRGFYVANLGEGLIAADNRYAGFELMKLKFEKNKSFCIPADNEDGSDFLTRHGFKQYRKASRMILGEKIVWDARRLYSRIGGNLG